MLTTAWTIRETPVFLEATAPCGRIRRYASDGHAELRCGAAYQVVAVMDATLFASMEALSAFWVRHATMLKTVRQHQKPIKPKSGKYQVRW